MVRLTEFQLVFSHIEKMVDRRQATTSFYLSVNTGILAVIGFLTKDAALTGAWWVVAVLLLLCAGTAACWIWRSLILKYEVLLGWWYARLRELEQATPDSSQLATREYNELYGGTSDRRSGKQVSMTRMELALNWVLIGLYAAFGLGVLVSWFTR